MFIPSLTKVDDQKEGLQSTFFCQINPKVDQLIAIDSTQGYLRVEVFRHRPTFRWGAHVMKKHQSRFGE